MNTKDYDAIRETVKLYVDGCAKGDGEYMKPAFHEAATINGAPIQTLFEGASEAGPADSEGIIDVLDINGDIALARVVLKNYFGKDYVDYHALKKEGDEWKILAKVFTEV